MAVINGTVGAMSNKFGKFSIVVDDVWYSSKFEINCARGDVVEFESGTNKDTGEALRWCQKLKVVGAGGGSAPSGGGGGASAAPAKAYVAKAAFPIGHDTKDRSIVRQNSLAHATKLYAENMDGLNPTEEDAVKIVELARIFEDYSSGDGDMREAKAELEAAGL